MDATEPWPLPQESVQYVFADNVIEHLPLDSGRKLLRHARRAMVRGGVIRLATPDVESIARIYLDNPAERDELLRRNAASGQLGVHPVDVLRGVFLDWGHHLGYLYDFDALSRELAAAGFVDIQRVKPGSSSYPALTRLEGRTGESGRSQLVVEARV